MDSPALTRYAPKVVKKVNDLTSETVAQQTREFLKGGGKVEKVPVIIHAQEYDGRQEQAKKKKVKRQWDKLRVDEA